MNLAINPERAAAIITRAGPMPALTLDEKFIYIWEAALEPLVSDTLAVIHARYESDKAFHKRLNEWMRDEQGWTLSEKDEAIIRDNLERAAKFSCYVLANKIIFYKALRRRFTRMRALKIRADLETGAELQALLTEFFDHAIATSHDYETVFRGDFGDTLPFLGRAAVAGWRALSEQTDAFDFTQINYEVLGQIFERLLSTAARHKFGQHYTRSEVVDLINAFCIRDPRATVMDPACGGGTFLVRAYQRKRDLTRGTLSHEQVLNDLYGLDISAYPIHLTTINLATRDLIARANHPFVVRKDFFKVNPGDQIFHVPLGGPQATWSEIPRVSAIVGNPPYVRHEKINEYYGAAYKRFLQGLAKKEWPAAELSGRSDILCYFFTHGLSFLEEGGWMGLLTSSTWLDIAYGFTLQKFLLDHFEVRAVFESNCEPWFTGARVTTAATILHRQTDAARRDENLVKFVWLKKPLAEFLTYAATEAGRRLTFEDLRDHVEGLAEDEETEAWRVRVVNQGELYRMGCLPFAAADDEDDEGGDQATEARAVQAHLPEHQAGGERAYTGYKWGIFLRAPEIFFKLLRRCEGRFITLNRLAEVQYGLKSGCDRFLFPHDVTATLLKELTDAELVDRYGIRRADAERVRIIRAGDGSVHLLEAKYLEPEVHGLMDIASVGLRAEALDRSVVLIPTRFPRTDKHARKYVEWGESEGCHTGKTCQSRVNGNRAWFDLTGRERGEIIWPKLQQYRHVVAYNPERLTCNCNLYDLFVSPDVDARLLCAVLNSTVVALMKFLFGSQMGREGNQVTETFDVKMMPTPDARQSSPAVQEKLSAALDSMRGREALHLVDVDSDEPGWTGELALADRQQLDDAVLELLGVTEAGEREALRAELYDEMTRLYRRIRATERVMQRYRSMTARGGRTTPHSLAEEIWDGLADKPVPRTLTDFVPGGARCEAVEMPAGRARLIKGHLFQPDAVQIGRTTIELNDAARCEFVKELADAGVSGEVAVPADGDVCRIAIAGYRAYIERVTDEFTGLASALTADENMQDCIVKELWKRVGR